MNRLAWILGGAAALACVGQACSSNDPAGNDDAGASSSSGSRPDASTGRATSSSSSGSSSSSSGGSSSGATPDAGNRCEAASARTEARYTECGVGFVILDSGTPPACTNERAAASERDAQCVEDASCGALRSDEDAGADEAAYFACLTGN